MKWMRFYRQSTEMMSIRTFFIVIGVFLSLLSISLSATATAEEIGLKMKGKNMSANIEGVPLRDVLVKITEAKGIWFRCDDALSKRKVSVRFSNLPLKKGIKRLLGTLSYCFLFDDEENLVGVTILASGSTGVSQDIGRRQGSTRRDAFQVLKNSQPPQNPDAKPIDMTVMRNHPLPENPHAKPIDTTVVRNSSPP